MRPRDLEKWLMRKTKAELRKILRKTGKEANIKLDDWKRRDVLGRLPIPTQNVINSWLRQNRGRFFVAPRGRKKKELVLYIRQAMAFLNLNEPAEQDETEKELTKIIKTLGDKWREWYDPSKFWQIYWDSIGAGQDTPAKREAYFQEAKRLLNECETAEEWYSKLEKSGVWL